jgi:very-short-patch-repair endonuclease
MIAGFIVDFYCSELQLVIEIDGEIHNQQKEYDAQRTIELEKLCLSVIRFTNNDILNNLDIVYRKLTNFISTQ